MRAPRNIEKKGKAVPLDSALGMLRTLISEHRRMHDKKIITREDAATLGISFDDLLQWTPYYRPDGTFDNDVIHKHSGMIEAIAEAGKFHHVAVSACLSGTDAGQTTNNFLRILDAVHAGDDDKNRIMRQLYKEKFPACSPQALFSLKKFKTMSFKEAMGKLVSCFMYREDTKTVIPVTAFLAMIPTLTAAELENFSMLDEAKLSRLSGNKTGVNQIKYLLVKTPIKQLHIYHVLGLSYEQSALMLQKSWDAEAQHWNRGKSSEISHATPEEIFTTPPQDDKNRFKTRGELLHELRCAHCIFTRDGKSKAILWRDVEQEILDLLREKGMGAFNNVSIKAISEPDIAGNLHRKRQIVDRWEKNISPVANDHVVPLMHYFGLAEPFIQAFRDAPNHTIETDPDNGQHRAANAYREHLRNRLDEMQNPLDIEPESFSPCMERGMHVDRLLSENWMARKTVKR